MGLRKILEALLGLAILATIVLAGAERPDGGMCLPWTLGCLAVVVVLAIVYSILFPDAKRTTDKR